MSNIIEDFINRYYPNDNQYQTQKGYRRTLNLFFQSIGEKSSKEYLNVFDKKGNVNNNKVMKIESDVETFFNYLKTNKNKRGRDFTPPTIKQYISRVNNFLKLNRINVSIGVLKLIHNRNIGENDNTSIKGTLTPEQFREVLSNCNPMYKSLFLILATSGIRIGEALKLEEKHINIDENPVRITIDVLSTKKRRRRNTFITEEAKRYYLNWMKKRDEYIEKRENYSSNKTINKALPNKKYIFPISETSTHQKWGRIIENTEFNNRDNITGILEYTIHSLRRFFVNQLEEVRIDGRSISFMKDGKLSTGSYSDFTKAVKIAKKEYIKGQYNLRVFESGIPEEEFTKMKQMELEKSRMVLEEREKADKKVAEAVAYTLRHNVSEKIIEELNREKALVKKLKESKRIERKYSIIISKILSGEIKVNKYEEELVKQFGVEGLPKDEKELNYMIENNTEFLDLCELIERIIKERE